MSLQTQQLVDEIEDIKSRLISMESLLIGDEEPEKDDAKALKTALEEYKMGKAVQLKL